MTSFDDAKAQRNRVLTEFDVEAVKKQLMENGQPPCDVDMLAVVTLHKARYECTDIDRILRAKSGEWLRQRHFKRMYGEELLPEGQLPE